MHSGQLIVCHNYLCGNFRNAPEYKNHCAALTNISNVTRDMECECLISKRKDELLTRHKKTKSKIEREEIEAELKEMS